VKRDGYAELVAKHNEIVKRGDIPGTAHIVRNADSSSAPPTSSSDDSDSDSDSNSDSDTELDETSELSDGTQSGSDKGILRGNNPTVSPAVALDEDGNDISMALRFRSDV
jgi:hypothetical protein